jgi:hypothetical protein
MLQNPCVVCLIGMGNTDYSAWLKYLRARPVRTCATRSIAEYLVQAWDVRNSCKHNGAVLPPLSAPEKRGADGVDAMA